MWKADINPLASSGIRLGSPAVTSADSGLPWLSAFLAQCSGCTINFLAVHWYSFLIWLVVMKRIHIFPGTERGLPILYFIFRKFIQCILITRSGLRNSLIRGLTLEVCHPLSEIGVVNWSKSQSRPWVHEASRSLYGCDWLDWEIFLVCIQGVIISQSCSHAHFLFREANHESVSVK